MTPVLAKNKLFLTVYTRVANGVESRPFLVRPGFLFLGQIRIPLSWSDPDSPFLVRSGFQGPDADSDSDVFKKSESDPILIKKKVGIRNTVIKILIYSSIKRLLSIAVQYFSFSVVRNLGGIYKESTFSLSKFGHIHRLYVVSYSYRYKIVI